MTPRLRIGFIWRSSLNDANALSGMPRGMHDALAACDATLVALRVGTSALTSEDLIRRARASVPGLRRVTRRMRRQAIATWSACPLVDEQGMLLRQAFRRARLVERALEHADVDVIFGCGASSALYDLRTSVPIVSYCDAPASIISATYPAAAERSAAYKDAMDELEQGALLRVRDGVFASTAARHAAITQYGLEPSRAHVVPMGANIVPIGELPARRLPTRDALTLCFVGASPERKRLDVAIGTAELLRDRGWNVVLRYVGPARRTASRSSVVRWEGRLQLSRAADRERMRVVYAQSHVLLLPSVGEAFGIAPCEAAHFGAPSVVSATGGLPTAVRHGRTGLVLPLDSGVEDYADAVESIAGDPDRYLALSANAMERARRELTWEHWAARMIEIMRDAAGHRAPSAAPAIRGVQPA
jgi:glycosyltransferase involved in cell wall biosynthesis